MNAIGWGEIAESIWIERPDLAGRYDAGIVQEYMNGDEPRPFADRPDTPLKRWLIENGAESTLMSTANLCYLHSKVKIALEQPRIAARYALDSYIRGWKKRGAKDEIIDAIVTSVASDATGRAMRIARSGKSAQEVLCSLRERP